jgi:hypothetical protein
MKIVYKESIYWLVMDRKLMPYYVVTAIKNTNQLAHMILLPYPII